MMPENLRQFDWETPDKLHLWQIYLNRESEFTASLFKLLSPDERQRAGKFRFKNDREDFIVTRGSLREILSHYTGIEPEQIRFTYNQFGKPALDNEKNDDSLYFNVSRSREVALCAIAFRREIGVDVEFVKKESASLEIAERFFSNNEAKSLKILPEDEQTDAFFRCWTRKEAYVKGVGEGLSHSLQNFSVPVGAEESIQLIINRDSQKTRRWSLTTFSPKPGYIAALAVEGATPEIEFRQWSNLPG